MELFMILPAKGKTIKGTNCSMARRNDEASGRDTPKTYKTP
jgi:hypothetical protein